MSCRRSEADALVKYALVLKAVGHVVCLSLFYPFSLPANASNKGENVSHWSAITQCQKCSDEQNGSESVEAALRTLLSWKTSKKSICHWMSASFRHSQEEKPNIWYDILQSKYHGLVVDRSCECALDYITTNAEKEQKGYLKKVWQDQNHKSFGFQSQNRFFLRSLRPAKWHIRFSIIHQEDIYKFILWMHSFAWSHFTGYSEKRDQPNAFDPLHNKRR